MRENIEDRIRRYMSNYALEKDTELTEYSPGSPDYYLAMGARDAASHFVDYIIGQELKDMIRESDPWRKQR